jgi:hypothetical protein
MGHEVHFHRKTTIFWDVAPCSPVEVHRLSEVCTVSIVRVMNDGPDDGGNTHLWNVGPLQWDYKALQPRRL